MGRFAGLWTAILIALNCQLVLGKSLCPQGYQRFVNKCFIMIPDLQELTFAKAKTSCPPNDTLVMPSDEVEILHTRDLVQNNSVSGFVFFGLSDIEREGEFVWQDAFQLKLELFAKVTKALSKSQELLQEMNTEENDCVALDYLGKLKIIDCEEMTNVVLCERAIKTGGMCGLKGERLSLD